MKLRLAVTAGTFFLAGVANAATSYPTSEDRKSGSGSHLDFTSCTLSKQAARAQLDESLRVPYSERGLVVENGPCAVMDPLQPAPTKVDEIYRR
jgi:hypothetical protein